MILLAIVDYDAGNLRSVLRACSEVGVSAEITRSKTRIRNAERVIFPGVGAAGAAMASLRSFDLDQALKDVLNEGMPFLGICMGLQVCFDYSEEGSTPTLGLLPGKVVRFQLDDPRLKIPHMGWNEVRVSRPHPLFDGVEAGNEFYFVHSYYPVPELAEHILATASYESDFCCACAAENFVGTQFHPEKSGRVGLSLLENFARWDGSIAE